MLTQTIGKAGKAPCYKCEKRSPGCHSECELYAEWRKSYTAEAEMAKKRREMDTRNMRDEIHSVSLKNRLDKELKR